MRTRVKNTVKTYVIRCPKTLWEEAKEHVNKNTTINEWLVGLIRSWVVLKNPEYDGETD